MNLVLCVHHEKLFDGLFFSTRCNRLVQLDTVIISLLYESTNSKQILHWKLNQNMRCASVIIMVTTKKPPNQPADQPTGQPTNQPNNQPTTDIYLYTWINGKTICCTYNSFWMQLQMLWLENHICICCVRGECKCSVQKKLVTNICLCHPNIP